MSGDPKYNTPTTINAHFPSKGALMHHAVYLPNYGTFGRGWWWGDYLTPPL
jgi:hypothetical protein